MVECGLLERVKIDETETVIWRSFRVSRTKWENEKRRPATGPALVSCLDWLRLARGSPEARNGPAVVE